MYIGKSPNLGQLYNPDVFSGDGSTTFTLTNSVTSDQSVIVSISGVKQQVSTYSISGFSLVFGTAPPTATNNIEVQYLGSSIDVGTVGSGAIGSSQVSADMVGGQTDATITASDELIYKDQTDGALKKDTVQGILDLATVSGLTNSSNATWMTVSADEEVNMPGQPVYSGHDSAGTQLNTTGASTLYTLKQRSEFYDIGGNHDLTSTYTAPITGKYLVIANQGVNGITTAADYFQIKIRTSNRNYNINYFYTTANWPWSECCVSGSVIADMDAGDTCYLTILGIGESGNVWDPTSSGENSNFMVYLLT